MGVRVRGPPDPLDALTHPDPARPSFDPISLAMVSFISLQHTRGQMSQNGTGPSAKRDDPPFNAFKTAQHMKASTGFTLVNLQPEYLADQSL
eukprot:1159291-Pelagomonas_calceolata.AAC.6